MKTAFRVLALAVTLATTAGCNLLVPFIFIGQHKRTVPAECNKLQGRRALVLVWADDATLFDYPHIRLELATYITDKIAAGVKDCELVDPQRVEDLLARNLDAAVDPVLTGKHFKADFVVYVELLKFQIREPATPDLVQAHVQAPVSVYDLTADPDETGRFTLNPVDVVCPESQPLLMSSRTALLVRQQAYERFSEKIARKFFDHKVDL